MKIPTRAAFPLLLSAALLAAGCDDEVEEPVPEGVSVEPADEPFATGGVSLPANVTVDTAQVTPPPGAAEVEGAEPVEGAGAPTPP